MRLRPIVPGWGWNSKSRGTWYHGGSTPPFGTMILLDLQLCLCSASDKRVGNGLGKNPQHFNRGLELGWSPKATPHFSLAGQDLKACKFQA